MLWPQRGGMEGRLGRAVTWAALLKARSLESEMETLGQLWLNILGWKEGRDRGCSGPA